MGRDGMSFPRSGDLGPLVFFLLLAATFAGLTSWGQDQMSNAQIARATSDPSSDLWYLYTEATLSVTPGQDFRKSNQMTLELQPSMPVLLTPEWRLLNFPDLVLATEGTPHGTQVSGVESFTWLSALSPKSAGSFSWAVGPFVSLPVSTDQMLAPSQWQFGAGGVLSWRRPNFIASAIIKAGWTTSGWGEEAGQLQIQYNLQRFFGDGYQVGLGRPRIEYTWNRDGSGGWDVPVGVDFGKVFRIGRLPVKVLLEYDFFVMNDSRWEPEHLVRLTIIPVLPGPQKGPLFD